MAETDNTAADPATFVHGEDAGWKVASLAAQRQIVSTLVSIRVGKEMTQKQVADRVGCDPSTISKLESGTDAELRWSEIGDYSRAVGIQSALVLEDPDQPATDRIKHRVFEIGDILDEIARLAHSVKDDPEIINSIHDFYKEIAYNFVFRYERAKERLPKIRSWSPSEADDMAEISDCIEGEEQDSESM